MVVSMRTTSVPQWSSDIATLASILAEVPMSRLVVIADSTAPGHAVDRWAASSGIATRAVRVEQFGDSAQLQLKDMLLEARVGWRFLVIAAEATAGRIRAELLRSGALEAEVLVLVTEAPDLDSTRLRRVFCAHCHTINVTESAVASTVLCSECSANLIVYYHYSRQHGAYLGFAAEAEEIE